MNLFSDTFLTNDWQVPGLYEDREQERGQLVSMARVLGLVWSCLQDLCCERAETQSVDAKIRI